MVSYILGSNWLWYFLNMVQILNMNNEYVFNLKVKIKKCRGKEKKIMHYIVFLKYWKIVTIMGMIGGNSTDSPQRDSFSLTLFYWKTYPNFSLEEKILSWYDANLSSNDVRVESYSQTNQVKVLIKSMTRSNNLLTMIIIKNMKEIWSFEKKY